MIPQTQIAKSLYSAEIDHTPQLRNYTLKTHINTQSTLIHSHQHSHIHTIHTHNTHTHTNE